MKIKWLTIGIIFLFLGIACSPGLTAEKIQEQSTIDQYPEITPVRIHCYEYNSDGCIEKNTILLPKNEYRKMTQALSLTSSLEEKLGVYQRYSVIPSDVTIQSLKEQFDYYITTKNINVSAIKKYVNVRETISEINEITNSHCKIQAGGQLGIHINVGMSPITRWGNFIQFPFFWNVWVFYLGLPELFFMPLYIPGIDLCDFNIDFLGGYVTTSDGDLPDGEASFWTMAMIILGFIGYYVEDIPLPFFNINNNYFGYAAFIKAVGKPIEYSEVSGIR
jgi:hypothetical protein